ncbi:hypothetical protein N7447_006002 [Penicillium robsamsonii]|uniref:uncharacterized protein n=1 Tax=Penicillium robsamsonii TaxID=1792511 RepID=UPI002548CEE2|nr:uncharacterized protein N7447_006002 [Penicillium robsamsonii]KAJ5823662.1 hypothetical protein N7447_006002 [Penicillium robsamsonii]
MPISTIHEAAKGAFEALFEAWAGKDLNSPLVATGAANFRGSSNRNKCPDSGWRPEYSAGGRATDWPTIAVEVVWTGAEYLLRNGDQEDQIELLSLAKLLKLSVIRPPNARKFQGAFEYPTKKIHTRKKPKNGSDFVLGPQEMEFVAYRVWDAQFKGRP